MTTATGIKIGYARVSTRDQDTFLQEDTLHAAGCERVVWEQGSGAKADRPGLTKVLDEQLREGDTLVVWKLDRLGRSLKDLIALVEDLQQRGVEFQSLRESIDTNTAGGKLVFHIFGALAEFEREATRERTYAGLDAARARGRKGGRKSALDEKKKASARKMLADPQMTVTEVARILGVSRTTLYRQVGTVKPERGSADGSRSDSGRGTYQTTTDKTRDEPSES